MSKDWYQDIVDFHREVMGDKFETTPHRPHLKQVALRASLIEEEVDETIQAMTGGSITGVADGIVDSIVVLLGTAVTYGIDIRPIWDEVHRTNMAKKGGPVREDGKKLKPEGWQPPKIKELLELQKLNLELHKKIIQAIDDFAESVITPAATELANK
jgi:predicted HAD superfamily Cof-like phosphohydrolase